VGPVELLADWSPMGTVAWTVQVWVSSGGGGGEGGVVVDGGGVLGVLLDEGEGLDGVWGVVVDGGVGGGGGGGRGGLPASTVPTTTPVSETTRLGEVVLAEASPAVSVL
jgi:hypothetical protein